MDRLDEFDLITLTPAVEFGTCRVGPARDRNEQPGGGDMRASRVDARVMMPIRQGGWRRVRTCGRDQAVARRTGSGADSRSAATADATAVWETG